MAKKSGKRIFDKQKIAQDWCFVCKDGGELMICDYGRCLKAYHPACVGKDNLDLASDKPWICGSHTCLVCKASSDFHCYCCKRAACSRDIGLIDFVHVKGKYGFCNNCLKLALLVEEDRNVDSDGESVDLKDRDTYEGLFREYYELVKEKEGFDVNILFASKDQLDKEKICQTSHNTGKHSEEENEQLSMDNGDFSDGEPPKKRLKKRRSTQKKTKKQEQDMLVASESAKKAEQNKISSIWYPAAAQSQFAALITENIKLVYLKKSLVLEIIKQPESSEAKIIGSFVWVKQPESSDNGIGHGSSDECNSESLFQVSNMDRDVCLTMLSDAEFTQEECDELQKQVKAGLHEKLTIVELEQKARILHEDITKHMIARELQTLQNRMDRANEKGWREEFFKLQEKRNLLMQPSYMSFKLENIPRVIPEDVEIESLDRNDKQMLICSDETIPMKQNIPGSTPEKIDVGVIPEVVEVESLAKDEDEQNVFVGWGSKALIRFLQLIGQDTRKRLSSYDVLSVVCKYAKEHNLIDPVKRRSILCDVQLEAVFGEKVVEICRLFRLLKSHIVENEERLLKDEPDHDLAGDDTEMLVAPKTEKKVDQNNISSILYSTAAENQVAALIPDNQMHQVSDETTPTKQNIPEEVPMVDDERDSIRAQMKPEDGAPCTGS